MSRDMNVYDFYIPVFVDGQISLKELKDEFRPKSQVPVMVIQNNQESFVPAFKLCSVCRQFAEKNIPKGQMFGILGMSKQDLFKFEQQTLILKWHDYPNKYKDGYEITVAIFENEFNLMHGGKRK